MNKTRRAGHAVLAAVAGMVFALVTPTVAAASEQAAPAGCPQPGQRVKTSSSPAIYLVDPDFRLRSIPDAETYFSLWDTWGYEVRDDVLSCYPNPVPLYDAELVKEPGDPRVYIWDAYFGFRHIVDGETFARYGFSWSKVKERSPVEPNADMPWYQ